MYRMSSTLLCVVYLLACVVTFNAAQTNCKGRCGAEFRRGDTCQCDYGCLVYGECCKDFESLCTTDDSCKGRCGESFKRGRQCDCDADCTKYKQCCPDHRMHCGAEEPTVSEATKPPTLSEGNNADDPSILLVSPTSYPPDGLSDDMDGQTYPNDEFSNDDLEVGPIPESSSGYGSSTVDLLDQITAEPTVKFSTETFTVFSPTQVMFSDKPTQNDDSSSSSLQPTTGGTPTENTDVSDPSSSSNPGSTLPPPTAAADQVSTPTSAPQTESPPPTISQELETVEDTTPPNTASYTPVAPGSTGPTQGLEAPGMENSQVTTIPSSTLDPTSIPQATTSNPDTESNTDSDPTEPPYSLADPKDESTSVSDLDALMTHSPPSTDAGLTTADPLSVTPEPTEPIPSEATSKPQDTLDPNKPSPAKPTVAEPSSKPETVAEPSSKPEAGAEPSSKPETVAEPSSKPEAGAEPSSKPETVTKPSSKPETVTKPSSTPETVAEPSSTPVTVTKPSSKPETVAEPSSKPDTVAEPSSKPETVAKPSSKPETVAKPSSKPETMAKPSSKPETMAKPSSKPETVAKPSSKPETMAKPSSKPETVAKPSSKPETVAKPSSKPETVAKPSSKPETVAKPSSKPETMAKPSSKPETKPVDPALTLDNPRDYQADDSNDTNLCSGRPVSAVTTLRNGTMVVFRGHYFWVVDRYMVPGPARGITQVWGVPSPIDTAFTRCNCQGKTYIFKGSQYWRFENDVLDPNYPKVIETGFDGLRGQITAALSVPQYQTRRESVYFFKKGGSVQKYSYQFGTSPTCSQKVRQYTVHTVRYRTARQAASVLGPAVNFRTSWRGFPSTITAAVSVPSVREPQGYKYYVFSRSKSYNVRMDSERPVIPPTANASPQSNDFFKCQKKV